MKKRQISETPDNWIVLSLSDDTAKFYKVFSTWAGGYLDGDRWKLNSGIVNIEEDETNYYFYGFSDSCYQCNKKRYGISTSYGQNILDAIIKQSETQDINIEKLDKTTDWMNLLKQIKDE